uniref:RNA helicase n=1 Tax=Tetraodon nigroviridis TaxID=99883 RepID=H3CDI3_TETNG
PFRKGSNRFLTVTKKDGSDKPQHSMLLSPSHNSLFVIHNLLERFPVSNKERLEMQPSSRSASSLVSEADSALDKNRASGRLNKGIPVVPPQRSPSELDVFRCSLPVQEHKQEILQLIRENRAVLVVGATGSGKTTQIPQFLLDECHKKREPCRIFCTQPRRLATITVADRVAAERGENVGKTVGYHIRLESRVSPKTVLTFCTSGVFLRTLMAGDASLSTVTHVIVDEVHERDGLTDFLLTKLREVLQKFPSLKLILSSAALDADLFRQYFGSCPVIHLKGRLFEVKELFLEDVLKLTGFRSKEVLKHDEVAQKGEKKRKSLTEWCETVKRSSAEEEEGSGGLPGDGAVLDREDGSFGSPDEGGPGQLEPWLVKEMDSCISSIFLNEDQDAFIQLFNLILYENVNVNYRHSETGTTALMVTAGQGFLPQMEQLLHMGADVGIKASNGWTAVDFAKHFHQNESMELLKSFLISREVCRPGGPAVDQQVTAESGDKDEELLKLYHQSFDDELVDLDLIMDLLHYICSTSSDGAVLIFLPGYDEIVSIRDRILYNDNRFSLQSERYQLFILHSEMQTQDQKKALKNPPAGVRKIILSTNIAETSITISDVVFVIDSGKGQKKSFDTLSRVSMLKTVWISKASALQRKGRAGRCKPGCCFHLFSRLRFDNMLEFQVPQLLRMPLQELCLQTKLLAPPSCQVAEFLSKAPQPPPAHAIKNALQMLKSIDAMEQHEDLTDLGFHLADLPVEPHLGKMVLCAVALKCLDPILTIACTLAYRDPFTLPAEGSKKKAALHCRKHFASSSFSDHMALLRAFQAWQKARSDGWERAFCEKYFLSQATMNMIFGMRTQLLGQLRAIGFVRAHGGSDIRDVNLNSENWAVVKAALVAGMYPNLAHIDQETALLSSSRKKKLHFHPTSVLNPAHLKEVGRPQSSPAQSPQNYPTEWLVYDEMSRGHRMVVTRCCSLVTPITAAIFAGCAKLPFPALEQPAEHRATGTQLDGTSDSEQRHRPAGRLRDQRLSGWLTCVCCCQAARLVYELRQKWQNLFLKRMRFPSKPWSQQDEAIIHAVVSVLAAEEHAAGLQQPAGIGQRPRPMAVEEDRSSPKSTAHLPAAAPSCSPLQDKTKPQELLPTRAMQRSMKAGGQSEDRGELVCVAGQSQGKDEDQSFSSGLGRGPQPRARSSGGQGAEKRPPRPSARLRSQTNQVGSIKISQQKGIWSTTTSNESKLSKAFVEDHLVILIFSVQGSGHFQGYARMTSVISQESCQDWDVLGLGGVFSVEWLQKESIPFHCTQHILNPWNDSKKVQISRDGQELEPQAAAQLLALWDRRAGRPAE